MGELMGGETDGREDVKRSERLRLAAVQHRSPLVLQEELHQEPEDRKFMKN